MGKEEERNEIIEKEKLKLKPSTQIQTEIERRKKEIQEIQDFLEQRADRFKAALEEVKHILKVYQQSSEGKSVIYQVASRGDFQGGNEIKEVESIYQKILDKRTGKKGPAKSNYSIKDVEDIVGTRVVCIYFSDIDTVRNYIRKCRAFKIFDDEPKQEGGYTAHHFTVGLTGKPELSGILCEIQISTMLLEAYYYKTHNLTYKGEFLEPGHEKLAELLNQSLVIIDKQSEVLKDQIMSLKEIERKIREVARRRFLNKLVEAHDEKCETLVKFIQNKEKEIYDEHHETIESIMSQVNEYKKRNVIDLNLVRVLCLLATTAKAGRFEGLCLDGIDELIYLSKDQPKELAHLYRIKSNICYGFGKVKEAYRFSKIALDYAIAQNDEETIADLKGNAAYFIAESCDKELEDEARMYSLEALETYPSDPFFIDTAGFVKIVFDDQYNEIKKGLEYCEQAYEGKTALEKEIGLIFLQIHRMIAHKRLHELISKESR